MARPRRLAGFAYVGRYRYFLTFCTYQRFPTLSDSETANRALIGFRRTARLEWFAILAYSLMPDHVHLLVEGGSPSSDLRRFMKRTKQSTGQAYSRAAKRPLWMEGYHDRIVRSDEEARSIARYIIENPVRAGLVSRPEDYPFVGSDVWPLE